MDVCGKDSLRKAFSHLTLRNSDQSISDMRHLLWYQFKNIICTLRAFTRRKGHHNNSSWKEWGMRQGQEEIIPTKKTEEIHSVPPGTWNSTGRFCIECKQHSCIFVSAGSPLFGRSFKVTVWIWVWWMTVLSVKWTVCVRERKWF